jgi:hypothetical protein
MITKTPPAHMGQEVKKNRGRDLPSAKKYLT